MSLNKDNNCNFPELPKLDEIQRARLMKYIMLVRQSFVTYLKRNPDDEFVHGTGILFTLLTKSLLDGCSTVEEFLARDPNRKYTVTLGKDIVVEENGNGSFYCMSCGNKTVFSTDNKMYMDSLKNFGVSLGCLHCFSEEIWKTFSEECEGGNL